MVPAHLRSASAIGPWFWVHTAFSYLLLLAGSLQLVHIIGAAPGIYRWQVIMLLLSAACRGPVTHCIWRASTPLYTLDPRPVAFAFSVLLLGWALLRFRSCSRAIHPWRDY